MMLERNQNNTDLDSWTNTKSNGVNTYKSKPVSDTNFASWTVPNVKTASDLDKDTT